MYDTQILEQSGFGVSDKNENVYVLKVTLANHVCMFNFNKLY